MVTLLCRISYGLLAFAAGYLLVGLVRSIAIRLGVIDVPNSRSSHRVPTPRGGGLAIAIVTLSAVAIAGAIDGTLRTAASCWIAGGALVALIGMIDDIRPLSAALRMGTHILAAAIIMTALHGTGEFIGLGILGSLLGCAVITWSINLFNFMDGTDGLAAAQSLFVAAAGAGLIGADNGPQALQLPLLALAGSSVAFFCWNFPPAKIFMGDVGSGFLGLSFATIALVTAALGLVSLWVWMILNALFLVDATVTLVSRLLRRQRIYLAHRSHAYQRLARRWNSHRAVLLTYAAINLFWCLPWAIAAWRLPSREQVFASLEAFPLILLALLAGAGKPEAQNPTITNQLSTSG